MKVQLSQADKAEILIAFRTGVLDTEKISGLKNYSSARRLTKEEAQELIWKLEKEH